MLLVDTNVLIDVLVNDPQWADWSVTQMRAQAQVQALVISPVIYAELAPAFHSIEALDRSIEILALRIEEPSRAALFLAGKAFAKYRKAGGRARGVLADFIIGAHAAVAGFGVLTRDAARYRSYFPTVELITP